MKDVVDLDLINRKKEELKNLDQAYNRICNIRLVICLLAMLTFVMSIMSRSWGLLIGFIFLAVAFVMLIMKHQMISEQRTYLQNEVAVVVRRWKRENDEWLDFEETGEEYLSETSYVEKDLDVFGRYSLYQYLCVAYTKFGRDRLAGYLTEKEPDFSVLKERQNAIEELLEKKEFSLAIEIYSHMIGQNKEQNNQDWYMAFVQYMRSEKKVFSSITRLIYTILPIVFVGSIIYSLLSGTYYEVPIILFLVQMVIAFVVKARYREEIYTMLSFFRNFGLYKKILSQIENESFESTYLKQLQSSITYKKGATKSLEKLDSLGGAFKVESNPYLYIILQGLCMWDIQWIRAMENWKSEYGKVMGEWIETIAEIEALLSLSVVGLHKDYVYPTFKEETKPLFIAEEIYHPLIKMKNVVRNSANLVAETDIITGSNMSGKTTFLRTVGINLILAYAGAPVCAKRLEVSRIALFTSMRVSDDISGGISTFYAEVLRIKDMVTFSKKKVGMLMLIDEIFKGTNSADRIVGATEVIKALSLPHTILLVSTHDFELCDLIPTHQIKGKNYHFDEFYKENQIHFDYKIKEGKCRTTNAQHILRMAGLMK